jgi:hypothetical protein
MKNTTILTALYWLITLAFSFSLFAEKYALAAFFALLIVVIQLNEISTYLAHTLLLLKENQTKIDTKI